MQGGQAQALGPAEPLPPPPSPLQEVKGDMRKHLDLLSQSEQSSDELVLSLYPLGIKRRVLR